MARARGTLVDGEPFPLWVRQSTYANQEVAGESHYLDALRRLVGPVGEEGAEIWTDAVLRPEPKNRHDSNAVAVVCAGETVGYLPKEDAREYAAPLSALVAAGWQPVTRARVWAGRREDWNDRRERYEPVLIAAVRLCLPEPHLLAPVNLPPDGPYVMLPVGSGIQVTGEEKHLDALAPLLVGAGECWVHATVHELVETGPRSTKTVVEVRIGGEPVGRLTPKMSGELLPAIQHLAGRGATTVVRALVKGNRLKADVVLHCRRSGELDSAWFDEPVQRTRQPESAVVKAESAVAPAEPPAPPSLPPAGWYLDPYSDVHWRWWDGSMWSAHQSPR